MVETQNWTLAKVTPALCPKCNTASLYRSHTLTKLEEKRKQIGRKRPFRCHACDWRGWLIDAELRYAASELNQKTRAAVQRDVDVPNISLESADAPLPPSGKRGPDGQGGDDGAYPAAAGSEITYHVHETDGEFRNDGESLPEDLTQDAAVIGQVGEPSRERNRTSEEFDTQSANGDGIMSEALPEFDEASGKPVSRKVSPGFHSHSRHTVQVCPKCSDPSLYRSRSRGAAEFLRKKFTNRRPYRCHRCGWRGWLSKGF